MLIIKGKIDSPPLIGRQTLKVLGMLLIDVTGSLKSPNKTVKAVNKQQESDQSRDQNKTELDKILDRYQQTFTGIGKAMQNGEEMRGAHHWSYNPNQKTRKNIWNVDLRLVNKSMMRTCQVQAPITEDFI